MSTSGNPFLMNRSDWSNCLSHELYLLCLSLPQVVAHKEDPRLREQEWGNFQDPTQMEAIMDERRKTGAFYYRFPTGER